MELITRQCFTQKTTDNQLYDILVAIDDISSSEYIDGEVQYYADLPITIGDPPIDSAYLVREGSGVWLINRHPAGIYVRLGNTGALTDWEYAVAFPDVFSDANLRIYNAVDASKEVKFNVSSVSPSTLRTLTVADQDGTIALAENVVAKEPTDAIPVNKIRALTQAQYDAIPVPDPNTLYATI